MAVDGTHGVERASGILSVYDRLVFNVIGLQETSRGEHSAFSQAGYLAYCSRECSDGNDGNKGQGEVGLVVRTSITRAARPPEFISDRLLKVTLELRGQAKAVTFLWCMPQPRHRMLVINTHFGRPWTELWRRYLDMNNCSC